MLLETLVVSTLGKSVIRLDEGTIRVSRKF